MTDHHVGRPLAHRAGERAAILQRRQQFAVVNVEHATGGAEDFGCRFHFGLAALGQRRAGHAVVPKIAVGGRDEFDVMSQRCPSRRRAAGVHFRVIGMGPEDDDSQLAVRGTLGRDRRRGFSGPARLAAAHRAHRHCRQEPAKRAHEKTLQEGAERPPEGGTANGRLKAELRTTAKNSTFYQTKKR